MPCLHDVKTHKTYSTMKNSGWIPLDKNLKNELPNHRPYTKLEAMFSHQLDIDDGIAYSVNGYSKLWQWSRNKVRNFINNIHEVKGHPKGHLRDRHGVNSGQSVHLIILDLQKQKDTHETVKGHLRDTPKDTTSKPIKTKTKRSLKDLDRQVDPKSHQYTSLFEEFWELQLRKVGKGAAFKSWKKACKKLHAKKIIGAWQKQVPYYEARFETSGTEPPHPATWLNQSRWADSPKIEKSRNGNIVTDDSAAADAVLADMKRKGQL